MDLDNQVQPPPLVINASKDTSTAKYRLRMAAKKKRFNELYKEDDKDSNIETCPVDMREEKENSTRFQLSSSLTEGTLENEITSSHYGKNNKQMENDLKMAAQIGERLLEENTSMKKKQELLQEEIHTLKEKCKRANTTIATLESKERSANHLDRKIERLTGSLQHAEEQISTLAAENGRLISERNQLKNRLESDVQAHEAAVSAVKVEKEEAIEELKGGHRKEIEKLRKAVQDANDRTHEAEAEIMCLQNDYKEMEKNASRLEANEKLHVNDVMKLTERIKELEEKVWETDRLREMVDKLNRANQELHGENVDLKNCLETTIERSNQLAASLQENSTALTSSAPQLFSPPCSIQKAVSHKDSIDTEEDGHVCKSLFDELNTSVDKSEAKEASSNQENDPLYIHFRLTATSVKINLHQAIPDYDPYSESSISYSELFTQTFKEGIPLHDWHTYLKTVFLNEYVDSNTPSL